jgi:tetratricopeptide (TPR) repeat protein
MTQAVLSSEEQELLAYHSSGVFDCASRVRLLALQEHAGESPLDMGTLPDMHFIIRYCHEHAQWSNVVAYYDRLYADLDHYGEWLETLTLNKWARDAASEVGDRGRYARYTHQRGALLHQRGAHQEAERLFHESETVFRSFGEGKPAIESLHMRALVTRAQGRLTEAQQICDRVVDEAKQLHLDGWLAHPLFIRGLLARDRGDLALAEHYVSESRSLLVADDEPAMTAQCEQFLGEIAMLRSDWSQARARLEASRELYRSIGGVRQLLGSQRLLADLARFENRQQDVESLYNEALVLAEQLGDQEQLARLLLAKAQVIAPQGNWPLAIDTLRAAILTYQATNNARAVTGLSALLAWWCLRRGRPREAVIAGVTAVQTARVTGLLYPKAILGMLARGRRL